MFSFSNVINMIIIFRKDMKCFKHNYRKAHFFELYIIFLVKIIRNRPGKCFARLDVDIYVWLRALGC